MTEQAKLVRWLASTGAAMQASPLRWWAPCSPGTASALWSALRPASHGAGHGQRPR